MIGHYRQMRMQLSQFRDGALFCLALWVAHSLRLLFGADYFGGKQIESFHEFIWLWLIIFPGAPLILETQGFYNRTLLPSRRETAWILLRGCALATVGIILVMFPLKMTLARAPIILFGIVSFIILYINEEITRFILQSKFGHGKLRRRFILVGGPEDTSECRQVLKEHSEDGIDPVADLDLNKKTPEDLIPLLHQHSANGVLIQGKHSSLGEIEKIIQICELEGVEAWLVSDFFKTSISRKSFDYFHDKPTLIFRSAPEVSWQGFAKLFLDFFGALVLIVLAAPLLLLVAILIKITSPGPILFRQSRCGLNGHPFTMLKFRSMVTNAEQRKHELEVLNEMSGPVFKVTNDPRITPIGKYLRKFSIDELPQLFNVLLGDMSLVGPRPLPPDEVSRFDDLAHRRRLSVKPGLTCLWQVSGRNNVTDFKEWVRLDLYYIDNWSIWLDLKILIKTIPVVLLGTGAK